jgi:hypothetical protein
MTEQHDQHDQHGKRSHWVFIGFVLVAGFLLFTEHRAHVLGALPYLLLLACPLMHLFMHHGHRHGGASRRPHRHDQDGEQP